MLKEIYDIRKLNEEDYRKWYSLMADDRKERVDSFRFADDKKRTVAGEMLAKKLISDLCNVSPEAVIVKIGENGKPYAVGLDVFFNISHSKNIVICAADSNPVGIDIEAKRKYKPSVAKRFCTAEEIAEIEKSEKPDEEFTKLWVKKEAYAKLTGTGLAGKILKTDLKADILQFSFEDYFICIAFYSAETDF